MSLADGAFYVSVAALIAAMLIGVILDKRSADRRDDQARGPRVLVRVRNAGERAERQLDSEQTLAFAVDDGLIRGPQQSEKFPIVGVLAVMRSRRHQQRACGMG